MLILLYGMYGRYLQNNIVKWNMPHFSLNTKTNIPSLSVNSNLRRKFDELKEPPCRQLGFPAISTYRGWNRLMFCTAFMLCTAIIFDVFNVICFSNVFYLVRSYLQEVRIRPHNIVCKKSMPSS